MKWMGLALVLTEAVLAQQVSLALQAPGGPSASPDTISETIPIKYALAVDVARTLHGLAVTNTPTSSDPTTQLFWRFLDAAREVERLGRRNIIVDERSNSLLVSASASDLARIKTVIARLDITTPQILLDGAVLELTRSSTPNGRKQGMPGSLGVLAKLGLSSGPWFSPSNKIMPSGARCRFSSLVRVASDPGAAADAFITNAGAAPRYIPRVQSSDAVPMYLFWDRDAPPGMSDPLRTLEVTCSITTNGWVLMDMRDAAGRSLARVMPKVVRPMWLTTKKEPPEQFVVHECETFMLSGAVETFLTPVFSRVELLDHLPWAGSLLNRIITSPVHKRQVEVVVLLRPTVIWSLPGTQWFLTRRTLHI